MYYIQRYNLVKINYLIKFNYLKGIYLQFIKKYIFKLFKAINISNLNVNLKK